MLYRSSIFRFEISIYIEKNDATSNTTAVRHHVKTYPQYLFKLQQQQRATPVQSQKISILRRVLPLHLTGTRSIRYTRYRTSIYDISKFDISMYGNFRSIYNRSKFDIRYMEVQYTRNFWLRYPTLRASIVYTSYVCCAVTAFLTTSPPVPAENSLGGGCLWGALRSIKNE